MSNHVVGKCLFTYIPPYSSGDTWWHVRNCLHYCHIHHLVAQNMFGNLKWPYANLWWHRCISTM